MTTTEPVRSWHRTIFSRGDQAYSHLHAAASAGHLALALHLDSDHGLTPSAAQFGSWCRDVEAHAAAHGVVMAPAQQPDTFSTTKYARTTSSDGGPADA